MRQKHFDKCQSCERVSNKKQDKTFFCAVFSHAYKKNGTILQCTLLLLKNCSNQGVYWQEIYAGKIWWLS